MGSPYNLYEALGARGVLDPFIKAGQSFGGEAADTIRSMLAGPPDRFDTPPSSQPGTGLFPGSLSPDNVPAPTNAIQNGVLFARGGQDFAGPGASPAIIMQQMRDHADPTGDLGGALYQLLQQQSGGMK